MEHANCFACVQNCTPEHVASFERRRGSAQPEASDCEPRGAGNPASSPSGHRLSVENTSDSVHNESIDDAVEDRANYILGRLGLSWEDLRGKRILDVGAGSAEFGAAARKRWIEVISLDSKVPGSDEDSTVHQTEGYIRGSAEHLPFADESFDVVVSHASVPLHAANDRAGVSRFIEEIRRVLKKGGECRFGPVGVGGGLFPMEDRDERADVSGIEEVNVDEEVRKTSLKTTSFLRELIPNLKNSTDDSMAQTNNFYSFTKET